VLGVGGATSWCGDRGEGVDAADVELDASAAAGVDEVVIVTT